MTGLARQLTEFAFASCDDLVTPAALDVMQLSLFDWLTVAYAGRDEPVSKAVRSVELANGGRNMASVIGAERRLPSRGAAMINGTIGHALDYDDTHFAHIGHVSTVVLPAALAVAEETGKSGDAMLRAALVGAEASIRTGLWLGRSHYEAGFHQTATAGIFGAVTAAAALKDTPRDQVGHAVALAASRASGLKAQFGTMAKPYHAGMAAAAGIEALSAAAHGVEANPEALDGPFGLAATHGGQGDTRAFELWEYLFPQISHKLYACCHGTHAAIEALSTLQGVEGITEVEIAVHPRWLDVCDIARPQTRLEAKFSLTLTGAMALRGMPMTRDSSFEPEIILDPDLVALRDRVTVRGDATLADTAAQVQVTGAAGAHKATHDLAIPAAYETRVAKVRAKSRDLIGQGLSDQLWDAVAEPGGPDVPRLMAMLR